jgi:hypothetical protein
MNIAALGEAVFFMNIRVSRQAVFFLNITILRQDFLFYEHCSTQTGGFVL